MLIGYQARRKTTSFTWWFYGALGSFLFLIFLLYMSLAAGHAVSVCGEIMRPEGVDGWFVTVKFPMMGILQRKPSFSLGQSQ
jgi:hypothetical protein